MSAAKPPSAARAARLRRALAAWYRAHRRDLPWRRTRDPYAIWVSEAMLQQTRVEAVQEHWTRFLARFPDVAALAAAEEDDVLAAWSGLGYYRRARSLHRTARALVERHGGSFPADREALLALPGVGPYTAGALLSIAFGRPAPLVDGNVARVLARLFAIEEPLELSATRRLLWSLAEALLPPAPGAGGEEPDPGTWSQALMELGALVCTPRAPRCPACPLASSCAARAAGEAERLPTRRPRRPSVPVALEALFVERAGAVLLVRRPPGGRMAGMWELPTRERAEPGEARLWPTSFPTLAEGALEPSGPELLRCAHAITHHRIELAVLAGRAGGARAAPARWCAPDEVRSLALTGMTRKALAGLGVATGAAPPGRRRR